MNVKQRAHAGKNVCGTMIRVVRTSSVVCIAAAQGLDFVMFDCEHGCFNTETLQDAFLTARALGIEAYARVPVATKDYVSRFLDLGADGIMSPMISTPEQAMELVKYAKYPPVGIRGFSNGTNVLYRKMSHTALMEEANERVMAIAQIETKEGVENAYEIAAVDGIDMLLIGPNDLSVSLGIPGDLNHPKEIEAIRRVADACIRHNKLFTVHGVPAFADQFKDVMSVIMQMGDTDALANTFGSIRAYADKFENPGLVH